MTKCKGLNFKANIDGTPSEGRIQVENGMVYLCQDKKDGADCQDKLGFRYSWRIRKGSPEDMKAAIINVTDFEIVPRDPETYRDWQVGDIVARNDKTKRTKEVIFRSGELVICKNADGDIDGGYTCGQLHRLGFRLVLTDIERQIIEERKKTEWKPQDGDICYVKGAHGVEWVFIKDAREYKTASYIRVILDNDCLDTVIACEKSIKELRPATDEEKQRLFDAMAKRGKRWNAEKKVVEDIPKPHEFKKGEPVLVRSELTDRWYIAVYQGKSDSPDRPYLISDGTMSDFEVSCIIPYNERTMHLLGKTEDYREE